MSKNRNGAFPNNKLGIIAGWGEFPALVAKEARAMGLQTVAVGFPEETEPRMAELVDEMHWLSLGQLGKLLSSFKKAGVQKAMMAGMIRHKQLFAKLKIDWEAVKLLTTLADKRADSILGAVADKLASEGIELISPLPMLKPYLPGPGVLTRKKPTAKEQADIEFGYKIAKHIAGADIGQTVVVKDQAVIAIEAMEGTDACILRSGKYNKKGGVVVKVTKPSQDLRFDTPVVGPRTIRSMKRARLSVIAFDAEKTLILEKEKTMADAGQAKIVMVAL